MVINGTAYAMPVQHDSPQMQQPLQYDSPQIAGNDCQPLTPSSDDEDGDRAFMRRKKKVFKALI